MFKHGQVGDVRALGIVIAVPWQCRSKKCRCSARHGRIGLLFKGAHTVGKMEYRPWSSIMVDQDWKGCERGSSLLDTGAVAKDLQCAVSQGIVDYWLACDGCAE